jgi:serine/threonine-protein kinase
VNEPGRVSGPASEQDATLVALPGESYERPVPVASATISGAVSQAPGSGERQVLAKRYEIVALLGAGGMGTVYRARDLELEETVALKVLRRELVDAPGILDRFRREVKLARRVTHRNVARVFDIGEHEGEKFLTMEFVDGEPLSAMLAREGALSTARAAAIARAIAEGLASAHAAGVVHRDLKPDNVLMARDGRVVLTDFGIARAAVGAVGASSTMGGLLGTPAYMAPEQVEGRDDVDARADVYAFGALLFELLTGERAWPGESPFAVASARLVAPPPDPRARKRGLPDAHAELVLGCLARHAADRPPSFEQVIALLDGLVHAAPAATLATPALPAPMPHAVHASRSSPSPTGPRHTPAPVEKTVAVLPFRNAGAPEDEYLAEELTDDLIDALSMTRGLKVRSRGMVLRFRGSEQDPRDLGRELGVQVVVEGSVRRARGSVRISARLVSVTDGFQLWAKRFDRPEQDVLSINDDAARAIAEALTLAGAREARDAPSNPAAIDLYIRARHEHRKFWPEHVARAIGLYEQALALAPEDPMILSALALALSRHSFFVGDGDFTKARRIAQQAIAAGPLLGESHLALGSVLFHTGEPAAAVQSLRYATQRSPGLADAHAALGRILVEVGAADEGIRRLEVALSLDPETPNARTEIGRALALVGRWDEANAEHEKLRGHDDAFAFWTARARMALWRRESDLAESYLVELGDDERALRIPQMMLHLARGKKLTPEINAQLASMSRPGVVGTRRRAFFLQMRAEIMGFVGDAEGLLTALEISVESGLIDRLWLERCPLLEGGRSHPRYAAVHAEVTRRSEEILAAYRAG